MKLSSGRRGRRTAGIAAAAVLIFGVAAAFSSDYVQAAASEALRATPEAHEPKALASLDPAVRAYVDAVDGADADALAAAFHEDGTVTDTGRRFHGREAIRAWAADEVIGGKVTVLGNTPGDNGSTVLLRFDPDGLLAGFRARYAFTLKDGLIHRVSMSYA
ncbi:nuclear transport factor 2 family protein [Streptomyces sp. NPDC047821]|uniref:nuclear transport factor 2 family protein n=1 Tax=Streptomyces sp. NPDC047821 TaxID=3365488 RepID=UPI003724014F